MDDVHFLVFRYIAKTIESIFLVTQIDVYVLDSKRIKYIEEYPIYVTEKLLFILLYLICIPILFISPYILLVLAMIFLVIVWAYGGGLASGNPYKRMAQDGTPNWGQTKQYKEEFDKGDRTDYDTINYLGGIGITWILTALAVIILFPELNTYM